MDEKNLKDKRISCKYGAKCYQKNEAHHEKYKHPPKNKDTNAQHSTKKFKAAHNVIVTKNGSDSEAEQSKNQSDADTNSSASSSEHVKKVNNDVSDSDSDTIEEDNSFETEDNSKELVSSEESKQKKSMESNKTDDKTSAVIITEKPLSKEVKKTSVNITEKPQEEKEWAVFIKEKFLVTMPEDFYQFWNFCKKLKPNNPLEAFKDVGLYLVGPFDVLAGKFLGVKKPESEYLIHWRYFRDPPELQTVLRSDDPAGYHIGYFRDSPDDMPVFLVSNYSKKNGILTQMGENIFSAVNIFLEELKKSGNPFKKMAIGRIQTSLIKETDRLGIDMSKKTKKIIEREKKIVTRTFNKIGLVVPYDKKTELGYRALALDNKTLENYLTKLQNAKTKEAEGAILTDLQPAFTFASIAADECDFGTGIELGWNIISHGIHSLNSTALQFLVSNYKLLNREAFAKIAEAHLKNRKQSLNLSIL